MFTNHEQRASVILPSSVDVDATQKLAPVVGLIEEDEEPHDNAGGPDGEAHGLQQQSAIGAAVEVVVDPEKAVRVDDPAVLVPEQRRIGEAAVARVVGVGLAGRAAAALAGEDVGVERALLETEVDLWGSRPGRGERVKCGTSK